MRQLITRIDDRLHARLKERARAEGRSLNALVTQALEAAVEPDDLPATVRARAEALGLHAPADAQADAPTLAEVRELTRGWGIAVSEALDRERAAR